MDSIDISLLPALRLLLSEKNISRAALKMNLSQPAMSRTFSKLKRDFNDPLMVRAGNQYQLTPRAQKLLQQLNQLMPQIENLWKNQELDLATIDQVMILAGTDMDVVYVSQKIDKIRQQAPNLEINIHTSTARALDDLINANIDFVLTAFEDERSGLFRQLLTQEKFVVIAGENCQLTPQQLDLPTYLSYQHGVFSFVENVRGKVDVALAAQGLSRNIKLRLPTFLQIPPFLADPRLLFSVPESFAHYLAQHFPLKILPLPFTAQDLPIYLYWHERQHNNKLHQWMRQQLLAN